MATRAWKVYGAEGHRQRESFNPSYSYDWTDGEDVRKIEVENSDKTGTNEYSIIRITRNTDAECKEELEGQLYDGIFENSRFGKVVEISTAKDEAIQNAIDKVVNVMSECIAGAADKDAFRAGLEAHTENMVLDFNDNGEFDMKFTKEELDDITGYAVGLLVDYFPQKVNVIYQGGESRKGNFAVDFMMAVVEVGGQEIELYAEMESPTASDYEEELADETATYEDLKTEILKQAAEAGIEEDTLNFMYG